MVNISRNGPFASPVGQSPPPLPPNACLLLLFPTIDYPEGGKYVRGEVLIYEVVLIWLIPSIHCRFQPQYPTSHPDDKHSILQLPIHHIYHTNSTIHLTLSTMDVANLISHGPDHLPKRPLYSPPSSKSFKFDDKSYFTAAPTPTTYYSRSPQPPLSPPVEDQPKCTLPSISTLFEGADSAAMHPASMSPRFSPKKYYKDRSN